MMSWLSSNQENIVIVIEISPFYRFDNKSFFIFTDVFEIIKNINWK